MKLLAAGLWVSTQLIQHPVDSASRVVTARDTLTVVQAQNDPAAVREAIIDALERAGRDGELDLSALDEARLLAVGYARVWQDSFWVRQVNRFAEMSRERRMSKRRGDSLRKAGVEAFTERGATAALRLWRRAAVSSRAAGDTSAIAGVLDNMAAAFTRLGRYDSAAVYLARARTLAKTVGDLRIEANVAGHQADLSADRSAFARARRQYTEALDLRTRIGDTRGIAADHNNIGLIEQGLGNFDEAQSRFETALALNRADNRVEAAATNTANLAELASARGEYAIAESYYKNALAAWREAGDEAETAFALFGLGQLEMRRGDYAAARRFLAEALRLYEATGSPEDVIAARQALADVLGASGDLQGALRHIDAGLRLADSAALNSSARATLALAEADLFGRLNEFSKAERRYADAVRLYRSAGDKNGEAEAMHGLGLLALERDNLAAARIHLIAALRIQSAAGNTRAAAITRIALGNVAAGARDFPTARQHYTRAARELESMHDPIASAAAVGERATLEVQSGNTGIAQTLYRDALSRIGDRSAADVTWRLRAGLGTLLRAQGARDAAAREFRAAISAAETISASLRLPQRRSGYLADKRAVYSELALLEVERGSIGAAFEATEKLRAREMMELLGKGRIASAAGDTPELVTREQDLRRQISELTNRVNAVLEPRERRRGPDVSRTSIELRARLLRAQNEYSDLQLRIRDRAPAYSTAVSARIASWRDVARRLQSDQAFVTYLITDSSSRAFVILRDTVASVSLTASRHELEQLVEFTRGVLDGRSAGAWRGPLRRLHASLIAPLEDAGLLAGKTRLVIVPHLELHYAPFAAFLTAGPREQFLGQRYELSFAPSASVWLTLAERRRQESHGVLAFAPRVDALPGSAQEVAAIRASLPDVLVAMGSGASEVAFRRDAPQRRIVHLATFGVLNKQNPLFSFVELQSGGPHDGVLEVNEIFGLSLRADLVVLSACQTALGSGAQADVPPGDDWVGLTRAFLHAGARQVLATLWPVDDWATAAFMERFYSELSRGISPARALTATQRAMSATSAMADPFYWAGFLLVGGPEGRTE